MRVLKPSRRSLKCSFIVTVSLAMGAGGFLANPGARGGLGQSRWISPFIRTTANSIWRERFFSTTISRSLLEEPTDEAEMHLRVQAMATLRGFLTTTIDDTNEANTIVLVANILAFSLNLHGVKEWKAGQPDDLRHLGFLPFPVDDVMCPGETKDLHLYEARFLALFENAIKNHGGCVGGAIFVDDGVLVRVGQLCDIISWNREQVGVSVALRCVGRVEIADMIAVEPYISATVREVNDFVGAESNVDGDNDEVSADIFALHRQCVQIEDKLSAAGGIGWESSGAGSGYFPGEQQRRDVDLSSDDKDGESINDEEDHDEDPLFDRTEDGNAIVQNFNDEEDRDGEEGDLMGKFRRGGGELDLTQIGPVSAQFSTGAGSSSSSTPGGSAGNDPQDDAGTRSAETGSGASRKVDAFAEEAGDEEGEGERQAGGVGGGESMNEGTKKLEDLLWGHESWQCDGFDSSLEEQVEDRYAALKMDVLVTLDGGGSDNGGISDPSSPEGSCSSIPQSGPSDGSGAEGPKTIADLLTSASSSVSQENPGGIFSAFGVSGAENGDNVEGGRGEKEEEFMWGCSSRQEERDQLLSFASLGCFDPSARLQALMLLTTGQRLRMARDALAERLKVLVAKSALNGLGN